MSTAPATIARSADGSAWAEVDALITAPDGTQYSANGAAYVPGFYLIAYAIEEPIVSDTARHLFGRGIAGGTLQTWNGDTLTRYTVTARWHTYTRWLGRIEWHAISATYEGVSYYGRYCVDTGQLVRLVPYAHQEGATR